MSFKRVALLALNLIVLAAFAVVMHRAGGISRLTAPWQPR